MPKSDLRLNAGAYAPVADRIALFYAAHPTGRIVTRLIERSGEIIVFRALVYRTAEETRPAATGWASERVGDGDVNAVACLENTETSAIGRALANLGFAASAERASREEMQKAARERARLASRAWASGPQRVSESSPPRLDSRRSQTGGGVLEGAIHDVLDLLGEAERSGLAPDRVARLRDRLRSGRTTLVGVERAEGALRRWLAAARGADALPP